MERQHHGFSYENDIINQFSFDKELKYNSIYDCYYKNIPIQIKLIKHKASICLGDYFRNKSKDKDFMLIVGFYNKKNNIINIIDENIIYVNHQDWNNMFQFHLDEEIKDFIKNISNDRKDDKKWKETINKYKLIWKSINKTTTINFKRDHKKQKRIQCSISYKNFIDIIKGDKWPKIEKTNLIDFLQKRT